MYPEDVSNSTLSAKFCINKGGHLSELQLCSSVPHIAVSEIFEFESQYSGKGFYLFCVTVSGMVFTVSCSVSAVKPIGFISHTEGRTNYNPTNTRCNQLIQYQLPKLVSRISGQHKICECFDLYHEQVPYEEAWSWQKEIVQKKKAQIEQNGYCNDTLIILQHRPVYTLGTGSSEENLNFSIKDAPFDVYRTERGGEVTFHGPGQLVIYPILNLRNHKMDLHWYLRALEEVVIRALSSTFSIKASRLEGLTGVWVGDRKVAAIGIRASQWITFHGVAVNVTTDLTPFDWIVPCGIRHRGVGSIKQLLSEQQLSVRYGSRDIHHPDDPFLLDITHKSLLQEFSEIFHVELISSS